MILKKFHPVKIFLPLPHQCPLHHASSSADVISGQKWTPVHQVQSQLQHVGFILSDGLQNNWRFNKILLAALHFQKKLIFKGVNLTKITS